MRNKDRESLKNVLDQGFTFTKRAKANQELEEVLGLFPSQALHLADLPGSGWREVNTRLGVLRLLPLTLCTDQARGMRYSQVVEAGHENACNSAR